MIFLCEQMYTKTYTNTQKEDPLTSISEQERMKELIRKISSSKNLIMKIATSTTKKEKI